MTQQTRYDYDVLILGGGLAGLTLTCLLGTVDSLRVACIERSTPDAPPQDERTTAISFGSSRILERAGVWNAIAAQGCPIRDIDILDAHSPVLLNFLSTEVEDKSFGWIVPNSHIRHCLMDRIQACAPDVTVIAPAKAQDFAVDETGTHITLEDGRILSAALVVGADGRHSAIRDFMDVSVRTWDYHQRAVVCIVLHAHPHHNKAVEHFRSSGPFAVLPMPDRADGRHCSSLVFTEHGRTRPSLMDLDDNTFQDTVAALFPAHYGAIEILDNKRAAYPLSLSHAAEYIAPRMALVADAAHGIHPIAGQGLNLGFRDLDTLSRLIAQAHARGEDIGAPALLETYQRKRRPDNMAMVAVTDALVRLFSNDKPPVRLLRQAGLRAVSRMAPVKRFFMRRAMGE